MKRLVPITLFVLIIMCCLIGDPIFALDLLVSLHVEDYKNIHVVIEGLSEGIKSTGLTDELLKAKVELQLRRNGLNPIEGFEDLDPFLYINLLTAGDAFNVSVSFQRWVHYSSGGRSYGTSATVWDKTSNGIFTKQTSFILECLADHLDMFINDYIEVNEKSKTSGTGE
jgi:hypothetical protein